MCRRYCERPQPAKTIGPDLGVVWLATPVPGCCRISLMIADGGTAISDLAVLRDQPNLFGEVGSSTPTAWRTLDAIDDDVLVRIAAARAAARARVWAAGADPGFIDACIAANIRFSVGHDLTEPVRSRQRHFLLGA